MKKQAKKTTARRSTHAHAETQAPEQSMLENFVDEMSTFANDNRKVLATLGIIAGAGVATFLAVKYVPWQTVYSKAEEIYSRLEDSFSELAEKEAAPVNEPVL